MLRLLVGLGNPATSYQDTRHNVGREFINFLAQQTKSKFTKSRQAEMFRLPSFFDLALDQPLICAKLSSFMNESGPALKNLLTSENIALDQVLVVVDDFMIPFGTMRLRSKGSSGGHNGLNSIIDVYGSEDFGRLRVGIGPVPPGEDPADYVLKEFTKSELGLLPALFSRINDGLKLLIQDGYQSTMTFLNTQNV